MEKKKRIIIGMTCMLVITLALLGITYAYYRTRIIGNESIDPSISVQSKKMEIVYSDGNANISANGIEPSDSFEKIFSVENTGDDTVNYSIFLEDIVNEFVRTEDLIISLECTSSKNIECSAINEDKKFSFPKVDTLLVMNEIAVGEKQTYKLKLNYVYLKDINQSEDMGKKLSGKIQIYDTTYYANEKSLAYKLISAAQSETSSTKFLNQPLSTPGLEVTTKQTVTISEIETLTQNDPNLYYQYSCEDYIFNELSGYTLVNPKIVKFSDYLNIYKSNPSCKWLTSVGGIKSQNGTRTNNVRGIYEVTNIDDNDISYKSLGITSSGEGVENTMSATLDDYGVSFYYRGNVEDNYLNYHGMCWRIIRVLGDGSVKLLLESTTECSDTMASNYILDGSKSVPYGADYDEETNTYIGDYIDATYGSILPKNKSMRGFFNWWLTESKNFNLDDLRKGDWCLNDKDDIYSYSNPYGYIGEKGSVSNISYNYATYIRLYRDYPEKATLKCESIGGTIIDDYIGTLTSDEVTFTGSKIGYTNNNFVVPERTRDYDWQLLTLHFFTYKSDAASYDNAAQIYGTGYFSAFDVSKPYYGFRPSIILNNTLEYASGDGTVNNAYKVK